MAERILVIEDDPDFLQILSHLLTTAGYVVTAARSGQEGLEKARATQPNLILTDLMLPQLNGYEICSLLKQDVRFRHIPIFLLSATKTQTKDERLAVECGADAYALKSLETGALLQKVHNLLAASEDSRGG